MLVIKNNEVTIIGMARVNNLAAQILLKLPNMVDSIIKPNVFNKGGAAFGASQ